MSDSTNQGSSNGDTANNPPIGQIPEIPRREIFYRRGRRRGGRLERMGFVLGVAIQAILPEIALNTGHDQGDLALEPVVVMETDNNPIVARSEPVVEPVEPEDPMDVIEGRAPVVEPDHEMEEFEEARGHDKSADELELEAEEPETLPAEEPNIAAPTPLRSCLKRSSPEKEDGGSPKRRRVSFSRAVDVQHHQRVLANNLNRPYVMTGEATDTGVERLKKPTDRVKPSRVTEDEVVELLEASGGPETLPKVGNPLTHRGCTCGEVCDESCSCLQMGIKCSGHYGCLCDPGKCGTGRPTAAANARLYVPGRAVSATEEYAKLEARGDSTISSVDDDNVFGDSVGGSEGNSNSTMILDQKAGEDDADTSNLDLDASFVDGEEGNADDEEEEELEDLDSSFVAREEVEDEEPSLRDPDVSMTQPDLSTAADSDKVINGDDESDTDSDASLSEVNDQHPTQPDSDSPTSVSAQSPPPDVEYEADDDDEEGQADTSVVQDDEVEVEDEAVVDEEDISAKDVGIHTRPTLLNRVSTVLGSFFSRSPPPAAVQHDDDAEGQSIEGQVEVEDVEKDEVEDSSVGCDGIEVEDVEEDEVEEEVAMDDVPVNQFVSVSTLDSPSHLIDSPLEEIEADDVATGCEDEEVNANIPETSLAPPVMASDLAAADGLSSCMDSDDDESVASSGRQSPVGQAALPASPPASPSSSSSSSDSDSSDDDVDLELPFDARPEQFPIEMLDLLPALIDQREIDSCLPNAWLRADGIFVGLMKIASDFNRRNAGTGRSCGVLHHSIFVEAMRLVERDLVAAGNGNGPQAAVLNELNQTAVADSTVYGNSWSELLIPIDIGNRHWAIAVVKRNAVQAVVLDSLSHPTTSPEKELREEQEKKVKLALRKILVAVGSIDPEDKTTHRFKVRYTFRKLRCIQTDGFDCGIFTLVHGRRVLERLSFNGATRAGKDDEVDLAGEREELKAVLEATKAYFVQLARRHEQLGHGPDGSLPITASKTPVILRWSGKC